MDDQHQFLAALNNLISQTVGTPVFSSGRDTGGARAPVPPSVTSATQDYMSPCHFDNLYEYLDIIYI